MHRHKSEMKIIVAIDEAGGFGKGGKLAWNKPNDLKRFQMITNDSHCIMGRRTYEDMYAMRKDKMKEGDLILPNRTSYVVTSSNKTLPGAIRVKSMSEAVQRIGDNKNIFVLGGLAMFIQALSWVNEIQMTIVEGTYDCDIFFPIDIVHRDFKIVGGEIANDLKFVTFRRK